MSPVKRNCVTEQGGWTDSLSSSKASIMLNCLWVHKTLDCVGVCWLRLTRLTMQKDRGILPAALPPTHGKGRRGDTAQLAGLQYRSLSRTAQGHCPETLREDVFEGLPPGSVGKGLRGSRPTCSLPWSLNRQAPSATFIPQAPL